MEEEEATDNMNIVESTTRDSGGESGNMSDGIMSPLDVKPTIAQLNLCDSQQEVTSATGDFLKKRGKLGKNDKSCSVCGDKALGYNFDAITCESCKAFFRRNAFKEKSLKCLFREQCLITMNTRRFCSYCRLHKCLAIGMRREMILGEMERKNRLKKVEENRKKKMCEKTSDTTISSGDERSLGSPAAADRSDCDAEMYDVDAAPNQRQLNDSEYSLIEKLGSLYSSTIAYTDDEPPAPDDLSLNQLINNTGWIVRKFIKFSKKIEDFMRLKQETQITLLKSCTLICVFIRSIFIYDMERNSWVTPTLETPTDVLKSATGHVMMQLYEEHIQLSRKLKPLLGQDPNLYGLLQIIALFSPENPGEGASGAHISNVQDRFIILLKHYLEATHTYAIARDMFPRILACIDELKVYSDRHGQVLLHVNTEQIDPILPEIFDLK